MHNVFLIPEAGGDAGVGALRCLMGLDNIDIVCMDALSWHAGMQLCPQACNVVVPNVSCDNAFDVFEQQTADIENGVILPTGEFFPSLLFDRECRFDTSMIPSREAWILSRDKWLLSQSFFFAAKTAREWSADRPFVKPRCGVGSRGCRMVMTQAEAAHIVGIEQEDVVFVEYIPGNDYVVDVVDDYAWTRVVHRQRGGADVCVDFVDGMYEIEEWSRQMAKILNVPVINAQYRKRADGSFALIDLGTRLSGASCMARLLGCNPILLMFGMCDFKRPLGRVVRRFEEVVCC